MNEESVARDLESMMVRLRRLDRELKRCPRWKLLRLRRLKKNWKQLSGRYLDLAYTRQLLREQAEIRDQLLVEENTDVTFFGATAHIGSLL